MALKWLLPDCVSVVLRDRERGSPGLHWGWPRTCDGRIRRSISRRDRPDFGGSLKLIKVQITAFGEVGDSVPSRHCRDRRAGRLMNAKIMSSELPDSSKSPAADAQAGQPIAVLRELLNAPKPKDKTWQAEAGQAVSMLGVRFLGESDDKTALRIVAMLGLAQSLGVKDARKRILKLARWSETAPPSLTTLVRKDEQLAALTALAKLVAPWSRIYAEEAAADPMLPQELLPSLLRWVRNTYADSLSFTHDFYAPQIWGVTTSERAITLLRESNKLLKPDRSEPATNLANGTSAVIDAFLESSHLETGDDKTRAIGIGLLLHLVQDQVAMAPGILLLPGFVMAFGRLSSAVSKEGTLGKQVTTAADALSQATISLLCVDLERRGERTAHHWRTLLPVWRAAYTNWDAMLAAASKSSSALAALTPDRDADNDHQQTDSYPVEAVFARLLPAWNAFVAELPEPGSAASLSAMLHQAAGLLGIAPLGEIGAIVPYDPLSHHLAQESSGSSPGRVRIIRPGVQVQRSDGSVRVLVAALVADV